MSHPLFLPNPGLGDCFQPLQRRKRHPPPRHFTEHCLKADCPSTHAQVGDSAAAFSARLRLPLLRSHSTEGERVLKWLPVLSSQPVFSTNFPKEEDDFVPDALPPTRQKEQLLTSLHAKWRSLLFAKQSEPFAC